MQRAPVVVMVNAREHPFCLYYEAVARARVYIKKDEKKVC